MLENPSYIIVFDQTDLTKDFMKTTRSTRVAKCRFYGYHSKVPDDDFLSPLKPVNVDEWLIAMNVGRQGRFFVDVKFTTIFNIFKHHNKLMHMRF
jgi:hypothetical protein